MSAHTPDSAVIVAPVSTARLLCAQSGLVIARFAVAASAAHEEQIVRAINTHAEMLAALKAVMDRCEIFENVPSDGGSVIASAHAAIAKAEGRA